ncbi:MAG TPA: alpha/beta hydrolase [Acidimicrobiales bacterium]|nr:alpha/beta hydrolase [Acidimicrobiales bacterium]
MRHRAAALVVLLAAGCSTTPRAAPQSSTSTTATTSTTTTSTTTTVPPAPPVPPVAWTPCQDGLQCGTVAAPLDYQHPDGRMIQIAVARHPARVPGERIGSLIINPGGPGDSGVDELPVELRVITADVQDRFDIVSFDPRGVERSSPVDCGTSGSTGLLPDPAPTTAAAQQALIANAQAYAADCEKHSGDILPFVDTYSAARDLDRIRAAVGDARLTYMGQSYGTFLGATYAELFPDRVRALVLDGAVDPALSTDDMDLEQAEAFEGNLDAFFSWCAGSSACPWRPGSDSRGALIALLDRLRRQPLPAGGGRQAGPGELVNAVFGTLDARSFFPSLGRALARAEGGDGGGIVALSDGYQTHGGPNTIDANTAITCLDHPTSRDLSTYPATAQAAAQGAPFFGPIEAWGAATCAVWPVPSQRVPHPIRAAGTPPILVIGTTHDPATPYLWAVRLAAELQNAVLVGRQGNDHVAYFYSPCVRSIVAGYVIAGTLPANQTLCPY